MPRHKKLNENETLNKQLCIAITKPMWTALQNMHIIKKREVLTEIREVIKKHTEENNK